MHYKNSKLKIFSPISCTTSFTNTKKKMAFFFVLALIIGTTLTLITYPGIFYSDSYGRWFMAREMSRLNFQALDDWLSVPPQILMAILYKITQNYASFTLLQSVAYFFTCFCAINIYVPKGKFIAGLLFVICPVYYGFSVYIEMSVICLVALLWLLILLTEVEYTNFNNWSLILKAIYFFICFSLYFIMVGFRQNAFTVLPVFILVLIKIGYQTKIWTMLYIHILSIVLSFSLIISLPTLLNYGHQNGSGSLSTGFLWETVTMLESLYEEPEYEDYIDYLGQEGTTELAVSANHNNSIYGYHDYIPNIVVGTGNNASLIRKGYFYLMFNESATYWNTKTSFWAMTLGITQPLAEIEYDYNRDNRMDEFNFSDTTRRQQFHQSYSSFMQAFPLFRTPWILFSLALGLMIITKLAKAMTIQDFEKIGIIYLLSVFYYGSFLVTTQSHEFRYFFLPLLLLYIIIISCFNSLTYRGIKKLRVK